MSKLIKLTSLESRNKNDNSFKCQCDDDIIIPPNSKVSLINAHISSGVVSSYEIDSEFQIGNDRGEKLGELYLTADNSDRKREILLDAGDYEISDALVDMTKQMNKSFMFSSQSGVTDAGSNTFNIPTEPDFGMGVICSLNKEKKVEITYNLGAQAYTSDLTYKNTNSGVQVDPATGAITYTAGAGLKTLSLNKASADNPNKTVYATITDPLQDFDNYTTVTLQDTTGANKNFPAQIDESSSEGINMDYNVQLDTTQVDTNNLTFVVSQSFLSTETIYDNVVKIGDTVTMDDGTGVLGTPSGSQITCDIANRELIPNNPYYKMDELEMLETLFDEVLPDLSVDATQDLGGDKAILTVPIDFDNVTDFHLINDAIFHLMKDDGDITGIFLIQKVSKGASNPDATDIEGTIFPIDGGFVLDEIKLINTYQFLNTINDSVDNFADLQLSDLDTLLFVLHNIKNDTYTELFTVETNNIQYNNTDNNIAIELLPNTYLSDKNNGFENSDLFHYKVMVNLFGDADYEVLITSFSRMITSNETLTANFNIAQNDTGVIQTQAETYTGFRYGQKTQFTNNDGENYVIVPVTSIKYGDAYQDYVNMKNMLFATIIRSSLLYKNDNSVRYKYTLTNFVRPTVDPAYLPLETRMWVGTQIEEVRKYTLVFPATRYDLRKYDLMVVGNNQVNENVACALEDHRLSHGCGRMCFLVQQVGLCKIGFIEEDTFVNINPAGAFFSVNIVGAPNNYVYSITNGGVEKAFKTDIEALSGDRICIQWGVSPSASDTEYNNSVNSATNPANLNRNSVFKSTGIIDERDRGKILVSILRAGAKNTYLYLGSPINAPNQVNGNLARAIPWTPRESPYMPPDYYDELKNFHMFVCPNTSSIIPLEITPDSTIVTVNGVTKQISSNVEPVHHDDSLHSVTNPDVIDQSYNLNAYTGNFNFTFTNQFLQKQLGFKTSQNALSGKTGTWVADLDYLSGYLPENLVVLLDNMQNIQTYDCNKTRGTRRNIIAVASNTQSRIGEINVEPNNLYRVSLENKEPINLRKFVVSFEDYYGNPLELQSSRAVVNLLFEQ